MKSYQKPLLKSTALQTKNIHDRKRRRQTRGSLRTPSHSRANTRRERGDYAMAESHRGQALSCCSYPDMAQSSVISQRLTTTNVYFLPLFLMHIDKMSRRTLIYITPPSSSFRAHLLRAENTVVPPPSQPLSTHVRLLTTVKTSSIAAAPEVPRSTIVHDARRPDEFGIQATDFVIDEDVGMLVSNENSTKYTPESISTTGSVLVLFVICRHTTKNIRMGVDS
ncbi:hypothetical protein BZA70DRAFT_75442 [Myxozyma melibiosi]|uniref:Uncharacterized protein n=1 Tax=Myxozyma melibiosi TaxID=54550 RepID=A0ABR1F2L8_9ASCO